MSNGWSEAVIQSRIRVNPEIVARYKGAGAPNEWSEWADIPAGPGTFKSERARVKALRERRPDEYEQFRFVLRTCVVIDYDLATGEVVGETKGG